MKKLAIIGSSDLAKQIAHYTISDNHYQIVGCFDDFQIKGEIKNNLEILGNIDSIEECYRQKIFDVLIIGIGYKHMAFRNELYARFEHTIPFGTIIHSSSYVDKSAIIGKGTIIYPGCTIDMGVEIGGNCILYNGCNIAHNSTIANHSILSPSVIIAGFCLIGENSNLGIGSIISDNITITNNVRTGAGAVVVKSIIESGLYIGIPAKKVKQ
jgi:sugar O-acyltransferase (sialic acid O-acetyltransferase NeuD family)